MTVCGDLLADQYGQFIKVKSYDTPYHFYFANIKELLVDFSVRLVVLMARSHAQSERLNGGEIPPRLAS